MNHGDIRVENDEYLNIQITPDRKIICPACEQLNPSYVTYCLNCGKSFIKTGNGEKKVKICPTCNTANPTYMMNCTHCGNLLNLPQEEQTNKYATPYNPDYIKRKNKSFALLLSVIMPGLGQAYLELYERAVFEIIATVLINWILITILSIRIMDLMNFTFYGFIYLVVMFFIWVFCMWDTSKCVSAINKNEKIPLLFTKLDLK